MLQRLNQRNVGIIRKNMTPDFFNHDMLAMYKAMHDLRVTIEDMIAEEDKVMCRNAGAGSIPPQVSGCSFMGLCSGASRVISSPSVGPQ